MDHKEDINDNNKLEETANEDTHSLLMRLGFSSELSIFAANKFPNDIMQAINYISTHNNITSHNLQSKIQPKLSRTMSIDDVTVVIKSMNDGGMDYESTYKKTLEMGFPEHLCFEAMQKFQENVTAATKYIKSNMSDENERKKE
eukprot:179499_1